MSGLATDETSVYARIAVVGYNGSWGALLSGGKLNVQDSREQMTSGGTNPVITVQSWTDNPVSYMISETFKIYYYKAPTWITTMTKAGIDQLETEVQKARDKVDQESFVYTDRPVIQNFTLIKANDMLQNIEALADIVPMTTKTAPDAPTIGSRITNDTLTALQAILDDMGSK